jgi:hypothetical protein
MRPIFFALPAGLALACAGGALMLAAKANRDLPRGIDPWLLPGAARHLVTPKMSAETAKASSNLLPTYRVGDSDGKTVVLAARGAARPQFVYFILDGCPCSYDADPLFRKLSKRFRGKVDFIAVTDGDRARAHDWSVQLLEPYPVIPDPEKKIIHAYGAKASVYSTLISTQGRVVKMWPGYSAGLLQDINATLASEAHVPVQPFDPEYAPKVKATGCAF